MTTREKRMYVIILAVFACFMAISSIKQETLVLESIGMDGMLLAKGMSTRVEPVGEEDVVVSYDYELYYEIGRENYEEDAAEPAIEPVKKSETNANPRDKGTDLWWLAHLIRGEADTKNTDDMRGVAIVAMNRVKSSSYPNTLSGVIKDKKFGTQYACYWDGNFNREPTEECWEIAQQVLNGERWGWPSDVIYQAQFKQGSGTYKVVVTRFGTHYYCHK